MSTFTDALPSKTLLGHPLGLYVCFLTEMWERFAFYGMKALLLLYLIQHHKFSDDDGYILLGTYAGLAYALPLLGGMIADRWLGMRKAVVYGGLLLVFGQLGMAYVGNPAEGISGSAVQDAFAVQVMYFSLALIGVGVGFLKPNISSIVGKLYTENDPRRDSGFTVFYMGINLGAMLSSLVVGYIGMSPEWGWGWGFGLAGVLMLFGLVQFLFGQKHLEGHAEPPNPAALREPVVGIPREWLIYLLGLVGVVVMWWVLQTKIDLGPLSALVGGHEVTLTEIVAVVLGLGLFVWFFWFLFSGITAVQRGRMIVLMSLIVISALFWGLYEQTYGTWVAFTERGMTKDLFPGFAKATGTPLPWSLLSLIVIPAGFLAAMRIAQKRGDGGAAKLLPTIALTLVLVFMLRDILIVPQTAGSLTFLGALFVVVLTPIFAALWPVLDRHRLNPSAPAKFGLGLVFAGLSMGVLAYAATQPGDNGLVNVWWLVAAYFVLELGEMVLSPIGLSAVTTLSVARVVGMMMGAWFLFSAFGEIIAGRFGTLASLDPNPDGSYDTAKALVVYGETFTTLMWVGLASGAVMLGLSPVLNRLTRERVVPAVAA